MLISIRIISQSTKNLIIPKSDSQQDSLILFLTKIIHMQMNKKQDNEATFKKGMTLDQYINEMKTTSQSNTQHREESGQSEEDEEDLYETTRMIRNKESMSKKLITYEIRESDEDNYDESEEPFHEDFREKTNLSTQLAFYQKSNKNIVNVVEPELKSSLMGNSRGFRVRLHSNSPFRNLKKEDSPKNSPNKSFSRTLHGNEWKLHSNASGSKEKEKILLPSNTLYGKFLRGVSEKKDNSKEKYFKKKNNQDMEQVLKYEREKNSKYGKKSQIFNMRVEGITDRLIERKSGKSKF